jgi:hypothetical protein
VFEFFVDSISEAGYVIGRNGDRDIPIGTMFTAMRRYRVHPDASSIWSEDTGVFVKVQLTLREVHWYGQGIDAVPRGHTAALAVAGEGLTLLTNALSSLPKHEYLSLVAAVDKIAERVAAADRPCE